VAGHPRLVRRRMVAFAQTLRVWSKYWKTYHFQCLEVAALERAKAVAWATGPSAAPVNAVEPQSHRVRDFLDFMVKREAVRQRRSTGSPPPWSDDWILNSFKFTNVKREHDATTRWMRENWTADRRDADAGQTIFNCALFRYFGTVAMGQRLQWVSSSFDPEDVLRLAVEVRASGLHVFTPAYCKPHFNSEGNFEQAVSVYEKVCYRYLNSLWRARKTLSDVATRTRSWKALVSELRTNVTHCSGSACSLSFNPLLLHHEQRTQSPALYNPAAVDSRIWRHWIYGKRNPGGCNAHSRVTWNCG